MSWYTDSEVAECAHCKHIIERMFTPTGWVWLARVWPTRGRAGYCYGRPHPRGGYEPHEPTT